MDKDWVQAGTHHEATYTNLDPGQYVLKVKAANNDGVWNQQGTATAIHIVITPPGGVPGGLTCCTAGWWPACYTRYGGILLAGKK